MRSLAKAFLRRMPDWMAFHSYRMWDAIQAKRAGAAPDESAALYCKLGLNRRVVAGPFAGMMYVERAYGSAYIPKLMGLYESELNETIEAATQAGCDLIVDIGAAEGYYAVGLAMRNPQTRVIAFEMYHVARHLLRRMSKLNAVQARVTVRQACTVESLRESLDGSAKPFVVCDCEGYEDVILDPSAVSKLQQAIILVEIHDQFVAGVSDRLRERFLKTHDLTHIVAQTKSRSVLPSEIQFTDQEVSAIVGDRAVPGQWFVLWPK